MSVDAAASEAALRHLAERLKKAEVELAVAVGNLAWKDKVIANLQRQLATVAEPDVAQRVVEAAHAQTNHTGREGS